MMRILVFIFFYLILTNQSFAKTGKGELKLDKYTMEYVIMYMYGAGNPNYTGGGSKKHDPEIMAISEDGTTSHYYYCPAEYRAYGCYSPSIVGDVIAKCEKRSGASRCSIFAKKRRIVWKNGGSKVSIKSKDLKSPYVVAKKIQDGGFYDGDISQLVGIDISTGQENTEIKITGEKIQTSNSNNNKNKDLVEELETLSKLYKSGSLSKEEFESAKKKLFNK